jgi:hypothetical protein
MSVIAASSVDVPGPPPTVATTELVAVAMMETEQEKPLPGPAPPGWLGLAGGCLRRHSLPGIGWIRVRVG